MQRNCTTQNSLRKEQSWRTNSRCKVIVTKTMWCWPNGRQIYQGDSLKIDAYLSGKLIFDKNFQNNVTGEEEKY